MELFLLQDLHSELEFINSRARNIQEQGQTLLLEIPDVEKDAIKEKLEKLQQDIASLEEETNLTSRHAISEIPGREGASAFVEVVVTKAAGQDVAENGDSDLGDSESGVSSMESFEGILRKGNGHSASENGVQVNGVSDDHFVNDESDEIVHLNGGLSVSPDEYQRIRLSHSADTNQDTNSSRDVDDDSRATGDKSAHVSVPVLIVTDEDGIRAEVEFAEDVEDGGQANEGFTEQADEFFFDDFDVYYGENTPKTVMDPDKTSIGEDTITSENESSEPKSGTIEESSSGDSNADDTVDHLQNGDVSEDLSNDLVLKDEGGSLESSIVTEVTLPSHKSVTDNPLPDDFDISVDSELGEDILRHSTPAEVIDSTPTEGNTTPDLQGNKSDPMELLINGPETQAPPQFDDVKRAESISDSFQGLDNVAKKSPSPTSQTGVKAVLTSSAPNEEMDKLDRLINIGEHSLENNARDLQAEKPHDKIASILSERRKAEEAERLRFAENSVRDTDYELFTSRPLDLVDRSSPLKDLDESESLLHENMSLDAFLVEVEKLLDKLRSIEELITTDMEDEDNVKDELAKHVVSTKNPCVISELHACLSFCQNHFD